MDNGFFLRRSEYNDILTIAPILPWLIDHMGIVCNDERFTRKSLLKSSISEDSVGRISINSLLGMWNEGKWIENTEGRDWYVYRLGKYYMMFNASGQVRKKLGSRKYLKQYLRYSYKVPFEWGEVNVNQLKRLYDSNSGLFGLQGN